MTYQTRKHLDKTKIFSFFLEFDFCRFCVVVRFFHPRHNGQWPPTLNDFYTRSNPLHYFPILILLKEPVFPFSMLSAKQGNYWYHFITSLVWRCPWLGIEPGTSRTRSQRSTTRLSRRRSISNENALHIKYITCKGYEHRSSNHVSLHFRDILQ